MGAVWALSAFKAQVNTKLYFVKYREGTYLWSLCKICKYFFICKVANFLPRILAVFFLCQQNSPELLEIFIRQKTPYWHRYYSPRVFVQTHSERMSKWAEPGISMLSFWWVIPTKPKTSTSRALPESYKERIPWKNNKCTTPRATQATLSTTKFPLTH